VNGEPVVLVRRDRRLARVDAHPHSRLDAVGPLARGERLLGGDRGEDCVLRPSERDEERVTLRANALATGILEDAA